MKHILAALLITTLPHAAFAQVPIYDTKGNLLGSATPPPAVVDQYQPLPCSTLIAHAHMVRTVINADSLGRLMAQALREHGYKSGGVINRQAVGRAIIDFAGCFEKGGPK